MGQKPLTCGTVGANMSQSGIFDSHTFEGSERLFARTHETSGRGAWPFTVGNEWRACHAWFFVVPS